MKPETKSAITMSIGCVCVLLMVFSSRLQIPDLMSKTLLLAFIICTYFSYRITQQAQKAGAFIPPSVNMKRQRFILTVVILAASSSATPFLMPYMGLKLPLSTRVIIAVLTFGIATSFLWAGYRKAKD